jgi:hypothetical protein
MDKRKNNQEHRGQWKQDEMNRSSTWRELEAARRVFEVFANELEGKQFTWKTDSLNAVRILKTGSMINDLQEVTIKLRLWKSEFCVQINGKWIARQFNRQADRLSRCVDYDDWSITQEAFLQIDSKWGPFQIDRFASLQNRKTERFNSQFAEKQTDGVDAFKQDWAFSQNIEEKINNWICPPVKVILSVLKKIKADKVTGTLVVPYWESAFYWPSIWQLIQERNNDPKQVWRFHTGFLIGEQMPDHTFNLYPNFDCLAIRFEDG